MMASQDKNEITLDAKHLNLENIEKEPEKENPKKSKLKGKQKKFQYLHLFIPRKELFNYLDPDINFHDTTRYRA